MEKFKLAWGRCGIFITAQGRKKLADFIENDVDDVYRIHTDGFIISNQKQFQFSNELGGFKLEKEGTFVIKNVNSVEMI